MSNSPDLEQLAKAGMPTSQASRHCGVSDKTLFDWHRAGLLPAPVKVGNLYLWDRLAIESIHGRRQAERGRRP